MAYPRDEYPGPREYVCDGTHSTANVHNIVDESKNASLQICICADPTCARVTSTLCNHVKCEWNESGTVLLCTFCGIDGT